MDAEADDVEAQLAMTRECYGECLSPMISGKTSNCPCSVVSDFDEWSDIDVCKTSLVNMSYQ